MSSFATLNIIQFLFSVNIYQCKPVSSDALCKTAFQTHPSIGELKDYLKRRK